MVQVPVWQTVSSPLQNCPSLHPVPSGSVWCVQTAAAAQTSSVQRFPSEVQSSPAGRAVQSIAQQDPFRPSAASSQSSPTSTIPSPQGARLARSSAGTLSSQMHMRLWQSGDVLTMLPGAMSALPFGVS